VGVRVDDDTNKTEYLLYLGEQEIGAIVEACDQHWETLEKRAEELAAQSKDSRQSRRDAKRDARKDAPRDVVDAINAALDGGRAADLALFGRMLADLPEKNIDAASQMAHAISTHQVTIDFDYYTAVDDLKPEDTAGADMIGTVEFNSACFYRYANVNVDQLLANLNNDTELAQKTLKAFVRACIEAVPTGKQNSFAAHNPPSFVFSVVRKRKAWSLANAFVRPVRPDGAGDLIQNSIRALDRYWRDLTGMYGEDDIHERYVATLEPGALETLADRRVENVEKLVEQTVEKTFNQQTRGGGSA
jgi:CRISPR system Cascade subunit CasC